MKKENSTLAKKIKGYSALAGSLLAISNIANAQIIYSDLVPDVTGSGNGASYDLDLNNDSTADFRFTISSNGGAGVKMLAEALASNAIAGTYNTAYPYIYPSALNLNDVIDENKTWNLGSNQTMASSGYFQGAYGKWFGATDKYMGLRLDIAGDDHYGWVRMDVSDDGKTFTFKDYAYESTAALAILAGDTGGGVGISEVNGNEISVFSFEKNVSIKLNENSGGLITISNLLGQTIKAAEITSSLMTINLADQATGIYLVTIEQNGQVFAKKVALQ